MKQINQPIVISYIFIFLLAFIWGVNFLFIKIAVLEISPVNNVFLRLILASTILYFYMRFTGNRLQLSINYLMFYFVIGALGNAIPFFLISTAEINIDAGIAGVLMSPMPLITLALSAIILRDEKINIFKSMSFITAFLGLLILFGFENLNQLGGENKIEFYSQIAALVGACSYALNAVISKLVPKINFISLATGVTIAATLLMLPFSIFYQPFWLESYSSPTVVSLLVQGIFATAIASLLFFKVIETRGPVFLSLINFLVPLIAYFSGVIFLGEIIRVNVLVSLSMILFALYLNHISNR